MKKPPSWAVTRRRLFAVFALLGVGHPRWGDFEKSALKSPETRMNTEKNRGDIYFVTPSWEGVTKLLSAGLILFEGIFSTKDQKEHSTKWESPVQNRYIWLFLQPVFSVFPFRCPFSIKRDKPRKMTWTPGLSHRNRGRNLACLIFEFQISTSVHCSAF